ncbi:hypothetical protein H9Q70_006691 [Fusarium xylarioides]|nr:hypothetical protein H9Q70_006691 [Fusarium xylarioides]KAG5803713.1 hypothetical protein H9Q71_011703 [Fusarium xylarioides]KAG5816832.1 hypothetical protein H9Q74_010888 [Fusarium xylarioides]
MVLKDNTASNIVQWGIDAKEEVEEIMEKVKNLNYEPESQLQNADMTLKKPAERDPATGSSTEEGFSVVKSKSETDDSAGRSNSGAADVWTKIAFTVTSEIIHHKQDEHGISEAFNSSAQSWFASVKAKSIF